MPSNVFDRASRFTVKLDPQGFLSWLLGLPPDDIAFGGWLDTRSIPFPAEPDRTNDTVARLDSVSGEEEPWALAVEFEVRPLLDMFGRFLNYLSGMWMNLRPDPEAGSRFQVGAAVINLTGRGNTSRQMSWPAAGVRTQLQVVERNLEEESARELLDLIESGRHSRCLLPWISLMSGADEPDIVDKWKVLAEREPDRRRRAEFAFVALLFAEKAGRKQLWFEKLEEWNVEESTVLEEFTRKREAKSEQRGEQRGKAIGETIGRLEATRSMILLFGAQKHGDPSPAIKSALGAVTDHDRLERIAKRILDSSDWNDVLSTQ